MTRRSLKLKPIFRINGKSPPSAALRRFKASGFRCFADMGAQTDVIEAGGAECGTQNDMAEIAPVDPSLPDFASCARCQELSTALMREKHENFGLWREILGGEDAAMPGPPQ